VEVANAALISYVVYDSANSASKILTQKDLFGNDVSDAEWTNALVSLEFNGVLGIVSAASLKASTLAAKTPTVAKGLINRLLYGTATEKAGAVGEMKAIAAASSATSQLRKAGIAVEETVLSIDAWAQPQLLRGKTIDVGLGNNLSPNFPGIDIFTAEARSVTSIKSLDSNATTYQSYNTLYGKLKDYTQKLADFQGGQQDWLDIKVLLKNFDTKILKLAIPGNGLNAEQLQAIIQIYKEINGTKDAYGKTIQFVVAVVKTLK
jgi:hypothetical protein